jgi:hypothetical protein
MHRVDSSAPCTRLAVPGAPMRRHVRQQQQPKQTKGPGGEWYATHFLVFWMRTAHDDKPETEKGPPLGGAHMHMLNEFTGPCSLTLTPARTCQATAAATHFPTMCFMERDRDSLITTLHTYITASCGWAIVWFQCGEWQWYQTKIGAETSAHMPIPHTGYSISCNHDPVENIICCGAAKQVMGQLLQMEGRALHCGSEGPYIRRAQEEFLQTPGYHGV